MSSGSIPLEFCTFKAVLSSECPNDADLAECVSNMGNETLCEADKTLPDGKSNYDINNCGNFDVFRCTRGNFVHI